MKRTVAPYRTGGCRTTLQDAGAVSCVFLDLAAPLRHDDAQKMVWRERGKKELGRQSLPVKRKNCQSEITPAKEELTLHAYRVKNRRKITLEFRRESFRFFQVYYTEPKKLISWR